MHTTPELATTYREGDLSKELFRECQGLGEHFGVKLVQGGLHHLHANPHIPIPEECTIEVYSVRAGA